MYAYLCESYDLYNMISMHIMLSCSCTLYTIGAYKEDRVRDWLERDGVFMPGLLYSQKGKVLLHTYSGT